MQKKRCRVLSILLAVLLLLTTLPVGVFADGNEGTETTDLVTKTEEGLWTHKSNATEVEKLLSESVNTIESLETKGADKYTVTLAEPLDTGTVTLNLTPGKTSKVTKEAQVQNAVGFTLPAGLTGGSSSDPATVTETTKDTNGTVTMKVTYTALYDGDGTTINGYTADTTYYIYTTTVTDSTGEATTTEKTEGTTVNLTDYKEGTVTNPVTNDANEQIGTETVVTVATKDTAGNITGYEITTTTVIEEQITVDDTDAKEVTSVKLPTRPEESVTKDPATGETTKVEVGDLYDDSNQLIGYTVTATVTDSAGNVLSSGSEAVCGELVVETTKVTAIETTTVTTQIISGNTIQKTTTTVTPTKQVTTELTVMKVSETFQLTGTGANGEVVDFAYEGAMSKVSDKSDVKATTTRQSTMANDYLSTVPAYSYNDSAMLQHFYGYDFSDQPANYYDDYDYRYIGSIVRSAVAANSTTSGYEYSVYQFLLTGADGNASFVYCADLSTAAVLYTGYNMENVEDASYYSADAAAHIKAIATNGYWGTSSGAGSLEAVKTMLRNNTNLTEAQITTLTPGMALTATQAAIWYYGNSSTKSQINYSNLADGYRITPYTYGGYTYNGTYLSNEQKTVLTTLCNYLINLSSSKVADTSTTLVTEENFAKKVSITLKDVTTENNTTKYTADISFSLDMTPTATDDLTISLLDSNGKKLTSKKLSEAATSNSRIYTLQNVTLAAGTTVTLQLTGTQELDEGAYLYSADAYQTSQTFVGVAQGTRNVDLSVNLSVGEEVPQAWVAYEGKAVTTNTTATRLIGDISVNVQLKTDVTTTHAQVTETTEKTETTVETTPIIRDYPTTPSTTKKEEEPETTEEPKETEEPQETEEPAPTETPDPTETPEPTPEPSETPEEPEEKIDEPSEVVTEELPDGSEEEIITYPDDVTVDVIITPEHTVTVTIDVPDDFTPEKVAIPIDYGPEDGTVGAEIRRPEQPVEDTRLDYTNGEVLVEVDGPMEIEIFDDFVPLSAMPELEEETVILEEEPVDIQPNTGDDRQILLLLSLVLLSGSALAVLTTRRVRRS